MSASPQLKPLPKGRGAQTNATGRYERQVRETFDDGWTEEDAALRQLRTVLHIDRARTILATNDSPDIGFDQSINPYRGCEHGCIYCYARPSHAYLGFSPGLDFESQLYFKPDAAQLLEKELSRKGYQPRVIHIGGNTDPYQPIERRLRITRQVLEVLDRFGHPCTIISKNALMARDVDILESLARRNLVRAVQSVTTLDRKLARAMEPRASTPRSPNRHPAPAGRGRSALRRQRGAHHSRPERPRNRSHRGAGRVRRRPGRPFHGPEVAARDQGTVSRMA
jgi:hypothetical protein